MIEKELQDRFVAPFDAARDALKKLNDVLAFLSKEGVAVEVNTIEAIEIGKPVSQTIIHIQLTKTKTEIDVRL